VAPGGGGMAQDLLEIRSFRYPMRYPKRKAVIGGKNKSLKNMI
jgi:hypothetical protein